MANGIVDTSTMAPMAGLPNYIVPTLPEGIVNPIGNQYNGFSSGSQISSNVLGSVGDILTGGAGSVIGSLVGAGAGVLMQNSQNKFNANQAALNRQFQTAEREAVQDWNLAQWNRQNEYNSPAAQYERLLKTGMNPVSALGMLSENGNVAGQLSSVPQAGSQAEAAGNGLGSSLANMFGDLGSRFNESELARSQVVAQDMANYYKPFDKEFEYKQAEAAIYQSVKSGELDEAQAHQIRELLPLVKGKSIMEIQEIAQSIEESQARIDEIMSQIDLNDAQTVTELYKQKLISAQTYEAYTASNLNIAKSEEAYANAQEAYSRIPVNMETANKIREEVTKMTYENGLRSKGINPDAPAMVQLIQHALHPGAGFGVSNGLGFLVDLGLLALPSVGAGAGLWKMGKTAYKGYRNYRRARKAGKAMKAAEVGKFISTGSGHIGFK